MLKRTLVIGLLGFWVMGMAGCATAKKQRDLEIQGLRNQISVLETHVQDKEQEIFVLKDELSRAREERIIVSEAPKRKTIIAEVKSRPKTKDIQIALMNAGFNPGNLDGRMGRKTRDGIRAFQKANNLAADGKVGKKTWALLKTYLYKKLK